MRKILIPSEMELLADKKKFPQVDPTAVMITLFLWEKGREVEQKIVKVLKDRYDLSEGRFCILLVLYRAPAGMHPSELADKGGVTRATITRLLQRMRHMGDIEVTTSEEDERQKIVRLTQKGRELMDELLPPHYERVAKLVAKLSSEEQKQLIALLKKMG